MTARPPRPPVPCVPRSEGRLQVGVGPRSWLVDGWPTDSTGGSAAAMLEGLVQAGLRDPAPSTSWEVLGTGTLAERLRRGVRDEQAKGRSDPVEERPDIAVLVYSHMVPVGTARRPDLRGRLVLPVLSQVGRVVVGPWTGTDDLPCLHCLDLHRRDRDPGWPQLARDLDDPLACPAEPTHPEPLLAVVQALVELLVVSTGPGSGTALGGLSHEVGPVAPHLITRRWAVHPACRWHGSGGRPG